MNRKIGFVCFGEVNTPIDRLNMKHDEGLGVIESMGYDVVDAGLVIDDPAYETADAAARKLQGADMCALVVCVAGWVPTHAVIRVTDQYRHIPMPESTTCRALLFSLVQCCIKGLTQPIFLRTSCKLHLP